MKRRTFLRNTALGTASVAVPSSVYALTTSKPEIKYIPANDDNTIHSVSDNLDDFKITVDRSRKLIDVQPLHAEYPMLNMLVYHRYIADLSDNIYHDGNDLIDITDSTPNYRVTDNMIVMTHGWKITPRGEHALYGAIERENKTVHSTIHILGSIDYRLTRNIILIDDQKRTYPTNNTGFIGVDLSSEPHEMTLLYECYSNVTGKWIPESYTFTSYYGVHYVPMFSMGNGGY